MSTAHLNVWVTKVGEPCKIDSERQWYVHVLHCDGSVLEWCNRRYQNIPTKCGHADIEVPPGQYLVVATWSPGAPGEHPTSLGNHISHLHVVRVNCGDHACVTLFPPTFHWCGIWWLIALRTHVRQGQLAGEDADAAAAAVERLLARVPIDPLTEAMNVLDDGGAKPRVKAD